MKSDINYLILLWAIKHNIKGIIIVHLNKKLIWKYEKLCLEPFATDTQHCCYRVTIIYSYFYGRASVDFSWRNLANFYKGKTHMWPSSSIHHLVKEHNRNKQPGFIGRTLGLALLADILPHFYFLVMWAWQRGQKTTSRSQFFPSVTWALGLNFSCQG